MPPLSPDEFALGLWRIRNGLTEIDRDLMQFRTLPPQRRDWLHVARRSLLFSSGQAGQRLGVTRATFLKIEERESSGKVTLAKLREAAEAIGCDLVYVIRPKNGLTFAEASWRRFAADVDAKAARRHSPPQMRGHMKLSIAMRLLESEKNLRRFIVNRQRRR